MLVHRATCPTTPATAATTTLLCLELMVHGSPGEGDNYESCVMFSAMYMHVHLNNVVSHHLLQAIPLSAL